MNPECNLISKSPYYLKMKIPGVPERINALLGHSYWKKHKNATLWKDLVKMTIGSNKPMKPLEKARITYIRHSQRMVDFDSLVVSGKPVIDGLVECGVLKDDSWAIVRKWDVDQFFSRKSVGSFIEIEVREVI